MGKRGLQVRNSREKNGLRLVMVIRLEYEFVPVVRVEAKLQQLMKAFTVVAALDFEERSIEELCAVVLCRFDQNVRRCEKYMEAGDFGHRWRKPADMPDFSGASLITGDTET